MPGLSLSQGCYQRQSLRLSCRQAQALSLEQKQERWKEDGGYYAHYLGWIGNVFQIKMQPSATCLKCYKELTVREIILGFRADVNDFTTQCPRCKVRFEATNLLDISTGREVPFYCGPQVLEQLTGKENLEVDEFLTKHPAIYHTALFHYGSLLHAFAKKRIEYRRETVDWKAKAKICLGNVPDTDVSLIFGVSIQKVVTERKKLKIQAFTGRRSIIPANWKPSSN